VSGAGTGGAIRPPLVTAPGFDRLEAARVGNFVTACYTMYNNGNAPLKPAPIDVPIGYTVHDYIIMSDFLIWGRRIQAFYGFIATNQDGSESVVAMRGTVGSTEWIDNILFAGFIPFDVNGVNYGMVHRGFGQIYQTIDVRPAGQDPNTATTRDDRTFADKVADAIARHRATIRAVAPNPRITVAAHSLGAALLTQYILENEIKRRLDNVVAFTFASPRVGDQTFVDAYNALPHITTWRIHLKEDLVPNLPPDTWGYVHVAQDIEFSTAGLGVQDNPVCNHVIATYLYVLDPAHNRIGDCKA